MYSQQPFHGQSYQENGEEHFPSQRMCSRSGEPSPTVASTQCDGNDSCHRARRMERYMQHERIHIGNIFSRRPIIRRFPAAQLAAWKMNLLVCDPYGRFLFIACADRILTIQLESLGRPRMEAEQIQEEERDKWAEETTQDEESMPFGEAIDSHDSSSSVHPSPAQPHTATHHSTFDPDASHQEGLFFWLSLPSVIDEESSAGGNEEEVVPPHVQQARREINTLRTIWYGSHALLACTLMSGHVILWELDRLTDPPIVRRCLRRDHDDQSAWSIGSTPQGYEWPLLVVGTNAHAAFRWKLEKQDQPESEAKQSAELVDRLPTPPASSTPFVPVGHNVPSVAISSCGRFLAIASIDSITRVFPLDYCGPGLTPMTEESISDEWGWNVHWVRRDSIVTCLDVTLDEVKEHRSHCEPQPSPPIQSNAAILEAELLDHMVDQLFLQLRAGGAIPDDLPPPAERIIRLQLRRHIQQQRRVHRAGGGGGDEDDGEDDEDAAAFDDDPMHDDELDHDDDDADADADADAEHEIDDEEELDDFGDGDAIEGDQDDMVDGDAEDEVDEDAADLHGLHDEPDAAHADADIPHDEMGWEAGFERHQEEPDNDDSDGANDAAALPSNQSDASREMDVDMKDPVVPDGMASAPASPNASADSAADSSAPAPATNVIPAATSSSHHAPSAASPSPTPSASISSIAPTARPIARVWPRKDLPDDLLIYASKTNVYLTDAKLNVLCSSKKVCASTLTIHRSLDRIVFLEWLDELGVMLIGSSAGDRLLLVRIVRYSCGEYEFRTESTIPEEASRVPIVGFSVHKVPTSTRTKESESLQQNLEEGEAAFKHDYGPWQPITTGDSPSPTSVTARLERECARYHVFILWAGGHVGGYELTMANGYAAHEAK